MGFLSAYATSLVAFMPYVLSVIKVILRNRNYKIEYLGSFRREAPFGHWLSRITVNTCRDALRKAKRHRGHLPLDGLSFDPDDSRPDDEQAARQAYDLLMKALAQLKPDERVILTLLGLEEKTIPEIGALTDGAKETSGPGAQARRALKRILEVHDDTKMIASTGSSRRQDVTGRIRQTSNGILKHG
jgi:RNA polymerase sigma factor (sigma-70 family)